MEPGAERAVGASPTVGSPPDAADAAEADVATALTHLSGLVQGVYARVAQRHDLTPVQARLLCVLIGGPRGMADLARIFGVERAALTGLLDRAERRGLATRTPVPGDRRAVQAGLTDPGRDAARAFHAAVGIELDRLLAPLEPADRDHLRATIAAITRPGPAGAAGR